MVDYWQKVLPFHFFCHEGASLVCRGRWWQEWCRDALLWDTDGGSEGRCVVTERAAGSLTLSLYRAHSAAVNAEPCSAGFFLVLNTNSSSDLALVASGFRCGPRWPSCEHTDAPRDFVLWQKEEVRINDAATAYYHCQDSHAPFHFLPGRLVRHFTSCNWFITFRCLTVYRLLVILWMYWDQASAVSGQKASVTYSLKQIHFTCYFYFVVYGVLDGSFYTPVNPKWFNKFIPG